MNRLLWNEQGEIACEKHAPPVGSDTRATGRWQTITLNDAIDFEAEVGYAPECEMCKAIARRVTR
ncbi:MAG: hypothetical protein IPJ77_07310 [Planctomycetes bacterium]|nr:hypothetical protein [Planctomycetota bacterium]